MRMNEAKVLLSIGFILLLGLLQIVFNAKKSRRVRQFPLLFMSAILMVIGVYVSGVFVCGDGAYADYKIQISAGVLPQIWF